MNVVLVEPEIPQNTGNIARTCVVTDSTLHLVEPLGFSLAQKEVRRAGLDYWSRLRLRVYPGYRSLREANSGRRFLFYSTRGGALYTGVDYAPGDFLVFGRETEGLPPGLLNDEPHVLRIPMAAGLTRSLNLANTVALVLYEALRQQGFPGMR